MAVTCSQSLVQQLNMRFELNIRLEEQVLHPWLKTTRLKFNPLEREHAVWVCQICPYRRRCQWTSQPNLRALCLWPFPQTSRCQSRVNRCEPMCIVSEFQYWRILTLETVKHSPIFPTRCWNLCPCGRCGLAHWIPACSSHCFLFLRRFEWRCAINASAQLHMKLQGWHFWNFWHGADGAVFSHPLELVPVGPGTPGQWTSRCAGEVACFIRPISGLTMSHRMIFQCRSDYSTWFYDIFFWQLMCDSISFLRWCRSLAMMKHMQWPQELGPLGLPAWHVDYWWLL